MQIVKKRFSKSDMQIQSYSFNKFAWSGYQMISNEIFIKEKLLQKEDFDKLISIKLCLD